jgi:hypothetical protein
MLAAAACEQAGAGARWAALCSLCLHVSALAAAASAAAADVRIEVCAREPLSVVRT